MTLDDKFSSENKFSSERVSVTLHELRAARATVSSKMSLQIDSGFGGASARAVCGGDGGFIQSKSSERGGRAGVSGGEMPRRETDALMQLEEAAVAAVKEPVVIGGRI